MKFLAFGPDFAGFDTTLRCGTIVGSVVGSALEWAPNTRPGLRFPLTASKLSRRIIKWILRNESLLKPQDRFKLR